MKRLFSLFLAIVLVVSCSVAQLGTANAVTTDTTDSTVSDNAIESVADENQIATLAEGESTGVISENEAIDYIPDVDSGNYTYTYSSGVEVPNADGNSVSVDTLDEWNFQSSGVYKVSSKKEFTDEVAVNSGSLTLYATKCVDFSKNDNHIGSFFTVGADASLRIFADGCYELDKDNNNNKISGSGVEFYGHETIAATAPAIICNQATELTLENVAFRNIHMFSGYLRVADDNVNSRSYTSGTVGNESDEGLSDPGEHFYKSSAITVAGGSTGNVTIKGCHFENLDGADYLNGTIAEKYSQATGGYLTYSIAKTGYTDNDHPFTSVNSYSSAINFTDTFSNAENSKVLITDCDFNFCNSVNGGAVSVESGNTVDNTITIANTNFLGCNARQLGGAVYVGAGKNSTVTTLRMDSCNVGTTKGNTAEIGGGVYCEGVLTLTDSTFNLNNTDITNFERKNYNTLNFDGAYSGGGSVYVSTPDGENSVIANTTIQNSKAISYGAGILVNGGKLTVAGSTIQNNEIPYRNPTNTDTFYEDCHGRGAGIAVLSQTLEAKLLDFVVEQNQGSDYGKLNDSNLIEAKEQQTSKYDIADVTCSSKLIINAYTASDGTTKTTKISNNTSAYGAGIYAEKTAFATNENPLQLDVITEIYSAEISDNTAEEIQQVTSDDGTTSVGKGGGIYSYQDLLIKDDSDGCTDIKILNNTAYGGGGGINISGFYEGNDSTEIGQSTVANESKSVLNIQGGLIQNNETQLYSGGGIAVWNGDGTVEAEITGVTFDGNYAKDNGGGIICGMAYDRNNSEQKAKKAFDTLVNLTDCTFTNNTTDGVGGAVHAHVENDTNITNCTIKNNYAATYGGGVCAWRDSEVTITSSEITENGIFTLGSAGAGIYSGAENLTISDSVISNNSGVNSRTDHTQNLDNCYNGAGLYIANSNSYYNGMEPSPDASTTYYQPEVILSKNTLSGNKVSLTNGNGGAIYNLGNLTMSGNTIKENQAGDGGAIFNGSCWDTTNDIKRNAPVVTSFNNTITGNSAVNAGGAIFSEGRFVDGKKGDNDVVAGGSTISGNTSENEAGAIKFQRNNNVSMEETLLLYGTTISENNATTSGGGVLFWCKTDNVNYAPEFCGVQIKDNVAGMRGGGVWINNIANEFVIKNSVISGNVAEAPSVDWTISGGGIFAAATANLTLTNTSVDNNVAGTKSEDGTLTGLHDGGGIGVRGNGAVIRIIGGSVSENVAKNGGGIACENGADVTAKGTEINNNTATYRGGGVYVDYGSESNGTSKFKYFMTSDKKVGLFGNLAGGEDFTDPDKAGDDVYRNNDDNPTYNVVVVPTSPDNNYGITLTNGSRAKWYQDDYNYIKPGASTSWSKLRVRNRTEFAVPQSLKESDYTNDTDSSYSDNFGEVYSSLDAQEAFEGITLKIIDATLKINCVVKDVYGTAYDNENAEYTYKLFDVNGNQITNISYSIDDSSTIYNDSTITLQAGQTATVRGLTAGDCKITEVTAKVDADENNNGISYVKSVTDFDSTTYTTNNSFNNVIQGVDTASKTIKLTAENTVEQIVENIVYAVDVKLNYYPRASVNNAPADMSTTATSVTQSFVGEEYVKAILSGVKSGDTLSTENTFTGMIANAGILTDDEYKLNNLIEEYVIFDSQANAVASVDDKSVRDLSNVDLTYHLDAYGNTIEGNTEKWVTYSNCTNVTRDTDNVITNKTLSEVTTTYDGNVDTITNPVDVTDISVWLFNTPKQYTVTVHNDTSAGFVSENGNLYYPTKGVEHQFYYNQRFGPAIDSEVADADTNHLKQYGLDGYTDVEIEAQETITYDGIELQFQYWSFDENGTEIASTDIKYRNRVTKNTKLYAIYGASQFTKVGLSVSEMESDFFTDGNGKEYLKLNSFINPYNVENSDPKITNVAAIYILCKGEDVTTQQKTAMRAALASYFEEHSLASLDLGGSNLTNSIKVEEIEKYIINYVNYNVASGESVDSSAFDVVLTNENRIHFSTTLPKTTVAGNTMLTFAAMHYDGDTIVSDNCIEYNFSATGDITHVDSEDSLGTGSGDDDDMEW